MNIKRYMLFALLYLWVGIGFAAQSSMMSQAVSQHLIPFFYTISRSDVSNHWTITSSEIAKPITFTEQEFLTILKRAPSDLTVPFLQGGNPMPFIKYLMVTNGDQSHIGNAPAHSQRDTVSVSAGNFGAGASASQSSFSGHQKTRERMRALVRQLPRTRTMHRTLTQHDIEAPYRTLQANGQKSQLLAKRDKIKSELESASRLGKLTIWRAWASHKNAELHALNKLLAQDVMEQLYQIRIQNSSQGADIVEHIASQWPYNIEGPLTPDKIAIIQQHVNAVGINELAAARRMLAMKKKAERYDACLVSADSSFMKAVQDELKTDLAQVTLSAHQREIQNRIDRIQVILDDPNFSLLVTLHAATPVEESYLIMEKIQSKPASLDILKAMQHSWRQKEGYLEFARLPEIEREARIENYLAQKIAAEKGLVLDSSSTGILQTNLSEMVSGKLEDTTDMTTDKPTIWYGNELSAEKTALFSAYHQEVHEALIREGLIDTDMPRVIQVAELFIETLAHELHPNQIKRDIDGIAQLASDVAHSAMSPINGVRGRSHLGHPYPRVIAALEAGVGGAQEVARRLVTPMEGVDKSPLVKLLRAAGDLTPEQIAIISAKATADWIKFEALSTVGAYVSQADVLGKVREAAQRVEKGTLTAEEARCALIADGIVLDVAAAESAAASAAESTSVLKNQSDKVRGTSKASRVTASGTVSKDFDQIAAAVKGLHPELERNIPQIEKLHDAVARAKERASSEKFGCIADGASVRDIEKIEQQAISFYERIRESSQDVAMISKNTGVPEDIITRIKSHVFLEEHLLESGTSRFFPNEDMAAAWQRLMDNTFSKSDLLLLQHEYAESFIMNGTQVSWREAHDLVNQFYNWNNSLKG